jgi:hypothetical protein
LTGFAKLKGYEAISLGAREIDMIILNPRYKMVKNAPSSNSFNLLMRAFDFMLHQICRDDISFSLLEGRYSDVSINLIHKPEILTDNAFIFDPEQMAAWWEEGHAYAPKMIPHA